LHLKVVFVVISALKHQKSKINIYSSILFFMKLKRYEISASTFQKQ